MICVRMALFRELTHCRNVALGDHHWARESGWPTEHQPEECHRAAHDQHICFDDTGTTAGLLLGNDGVRMVLIRRRDVAESGRTVCGLLTGNTNAEVAQVLGSF